MSEVITVRINFDVNTDSAEKKLTKVVTQAELAERTVLRALSVVRRLSGHEDLNRAISLIQRAVMIVNQLMIVSSLLAATNPWLFALGIIGAVGLGADITDFGMSLGGW